MGGEPVSLRVVGTPGDLAIIGFGAGLRIHPLPTLYGVLYIKHSTQRLAKGTINSVGTFRITKEVPATWSQDEEYYLQALIGNELSNVYAVAVE